MNQILPDKYKNLSDEQLKIRIAQVKQRLDKRLLILGHHYQRDEVLEFADFRGDSLGLCQKAAQQKAADFIVFCGVHFMAESADILSADHQIVQLPDVTAGCPLADFANIEQVEDAWKKINTICGAGRVTPITYINSKAELKAFCGRNAGAVCTSSNAHLVIKWAFQQTEKIFFFPDQYLGKNTVLKMQISPDEIVLWNDGEPDLERKIAKARVILWDGYCHVHTNFTIDHIKNMRQSQPQATIIVHPECNDDVVRLSDESGSTGDIVKYVEQAPVGSTIIIGTELHLVQRLKNQYKNKTILPLARSLCPNMFKINLNNLCWILDNPGEVNIIKVPPDITADAKVALERMLLLRNQK